MRFGLFGGSGEENPFARYRREKAEELKSLSSIHNTYLLRRPFPCDSHTRGQVQKMCAVDSLSGSAILVGLFLLFDWIYKVQGTWYVYVLMYVVLVILFMILNWNRYLKHCAVLTNSGKENED